MKSVLITAFDPYDRWIENSSWLCLLELTRELPERPHITTRRYPVDFAQVRERLERDLEANYDVALHLGQSPGTSAVHLEAVGLNIGGSLDEVPEQFQALASDGPIAYRSALPLARWAQRLREAGIPAQVSYHAGTYLCNATLYWSHYLAQNKGLVTRSAFLHLPLCTTQVIEARQELPSLPAAMTAAAVRLILEAVADES